MSLSSVQIRAGAELELRRRRTALCRRLSEPVLVHSKTERDALKKSDPYAAQYLAWTPQQWEAFQATAHCLWVLFGGAKGGGKTVGGVRLAQWYIANSTGGVHLVMRRNYTDLYTTTYETYEQYFPKELVIRKTEDVWYCINGWQIWFYALDNTKDPNYEKIGGMEVTTIHAEEVSQMPQKFYEGVSAALRRDAYFTKDKNPIPHWIFGTCNPHPGQHWTKKIFIDPRTRRSETYVNADGHLIPHKFIQALPDNNPMLADSYIRNAFGNMEGAMKAMLRFGKWDVDISDFVIVPQGVLKEVTTDPRTRVPIAAGIDIGLGRPDKTVVYFANEFGEMWEEAVIDEYDTFEQKNKLRPLIRQVQQNGGVVYIDSSSVGAGIANDMMHEFGPEVMTSAQFGEGPETEGGLDTSKKYTKRRAQMYWWFRLDCMNTAKNEDTFFGQVYVQSNDLLIEEIENTYYLPEDGKITIEKKADIKERIGRSPDHFDAVVLCNAARRRHSLTKNFHTPTISRTKSSSRTQYAGY